jgi:hypothetical protein
MLSAGCGELSILSVTQGEDRLHSNRPAFYHRLMQAMQISRLKCQCRQLQYLISP